ncbi:uncharacterized protein STEHIDRAFT_104838 [Stereum hirsutum FP-91666 SS1]|uniref:uncharacterized protein n=1 Tax=Stereum hirsutum (strain FP-91666) TaxID=721885 RepID=UPI000444A411|nr:uncharacterized protein STEHIDRAFT_104838 [Stereum hirsutum FP-91666 SS1]EIM80557.1 hypothetical protein STEHIDRAFT_104838 [Stereum hirsutum FP-91666 SS1]
MSRSLPSATSMSPVLTPLTERVMRHDQYYIQGGDVIFRVENYLFRVHRYFFVRESPYFRDKLPHPPPPGEHVQGANDHNPFVLEDALSEDFARFLWVFYNPKYSIYGANVVEWTSILKLAHQWSFPEIKALAVRELERLTIDAVSKIVIYHSYAIDRSLLIQSYMTLCTREDPISLDEGKALGLETSLMLARAREVCRGPKPNNGMRSPTVSVSGVELEKLIKDVLQLESLSALELTGVAPISTTGLTATTPGSSRNSAVTPITASMMNSFRSPAGGLVMTHLPSPDPFADHRFVAFPDM